MVLNAEQAIAVLVGIVWADQLEDEKIAHVMAQIHEAIVAHAGRPDTSLDEFHCIKSTDVVVVHHELHALPFRIRPIGVLEPNRKVEDRFAFLYPLFEFLK